MIIIGLGILKRIPGGKAILNSYLSKITHKLSDEMSKSTDKFEKFQKLPKDGMPKKELYKLLDKLQKK